MSEKLHFRISSALKDIIGKDLITDDYIAVFELVKNAYDAGASKVNILFQDIYGLAPKITIKDDGKGMNKTDILNKWLFVAYSAKKEGTEDNDYRRKIYSNRPYAGSKGIGRFSCDRLGKKLKLISVKQDSPNLSHILITDWEEFEKNLRDEFKDVEVDYSRQKKNLLDSNKGTSLEITELRSEWDRLKFLKLKDSLAKLINPSKEKGKPKFKIFIDVPEEEINDSTQTEYFKKVNGEIKNFIFETLELKTTYINCKISDNGKEILTELKDGQTLIYRVKEKSGYKNLKNIEFNLFYLNQSAKLTFARKMGISTVNYGSVALYKNGFRIYPFGEPGEDTLGLDKRKGQGYSRYLGTRDLIGRIEIMGLNEEFRETSSRGDGLIKTKSYYELVDCFYDRVLKRLERYVVDVQEWGLSIEGDFNSTQKDVFLKAVTDNLIKVTSENDILDIEYNPDIEKIITEIQNDSAIAVAKNLKRIALESGNQRLLSISVSVEEKMKAFSETISKSNLKSEEERLRLKRIEYELAEITSENLFLKSLKSQEFKEIISLLHHVGIYAGTIDNYLTGLYKKVANNQPIDKKEFSEILKIVSFEVKKIINISAFATKANFKLNTETIKTSVDDYIREYIRNILPTIVSKNLKIHFNNENPTPYITEIRPIELNIVIDNLVDNAKKADATRIDVLIRRNKDYHLEILFQDNGKGIPEQNISRIFDFGFTTTQGSGLGLYHLKQIIDRLKGKIRVTSREDEGTTFIITLN